MKSVNHIAIIMLITSTIHANGPYPSEFTKKIHKQTLKDLPFSNTQDFADATRGLIAPLINQGIIKDAKDSFIWNNPAFDFLQAKDSSTVNPSLWRQAQLLAITGLFKVTESIYQVRGADLSNMTIIEGNTSIIIVDPLVSTETAAAALKLYYQHRPYMPISTIIYTHSHIDHFGGVKGLVTQQEIDEEKIQILAPKGFTQAALEENVLLGNAMARRASYMYGSLLPKSPLGQVTSGLGLATSAGTTSLLLPTDLIKTTGEKRIIDGIKFIFLMTPHSEAPAEFLFYLPQFKALCAAEDATHTQHNLYTLRGAKVRDSKAWASYLQQAIDVFGPYVKVVFAQHHWPIWGNTQINEFLEKQRDLYKYLHDQTIRLANHGYTMVEIAQMIKLPSSLNEWYNQGYYGSISHNVKAIYNFYLGWFDGNPANLHPLPPVEASKKYVEYMGGSTHVLQKALKDYKLGEYRWVAQVVNHIVYAEPGNQLAKQLLAKTYEQLGYQTDNATWRNFYLTGAQELRNGVNTNLPTPETTGIDVLSSMPMELLFDYLAVRLNGEKAAKTPLLFDILLSDTQQTYTIEIKHGVLHAHKTRAGKASKNQITMTRNDLNNLIANKVTIEQLIKAKKITISGDKGLFNSFLQLLDTFNFWFTIVTPNKA